MILGQKGSGKTTLAKKIISNLDRVFVLDVLDEYNLESINDEKELINICKEIIKNKSKSFKYSIKIDNDKFLINAIKILWIFAKFYNNWWLVGEEASYYVNLNVRTGEILNFIRYGRHYEVNQIYISRNTAEISKYLTSQADLIISFKQIEPRHKEVLEKYGFDIEKLDKLKKYDYITVGDVSILNKLLKTKKEK